MLTVASIAPAAARAGECDSCCKDMINGSSCNNRQAKTACGEGATSTNCQNGCGPGETLHGLIQAVNSVSGADLTAACDAHDHCYNTCSIGRDFCDEQLLARLMQACDTRWSGQFQFLVKAWCQAVASSNYYAVRGDLLSSAWNADQVANCQCCDGCTTPPKTIDMSSDPNNCGMCANVCPAGVQCTGGVCGCPNPCTSNGVSHCCSDTQTCCPFYDGTQQCRFSAGGTCGPCEFACGDIPCCDWASYNTCCRLADYSFKCGRGGCN
jgi:hypothetical protein